MRNTVLGRKLNRTSAQRRSLFRSLVSCLILHEQIQTTQAKAKAVRSIVDRMIFRAKRADLSARREVIAYLPHAGAVRKVFEVLVPRYQERTTGFSRMYRIGARRGDAAPMVRMELIDKEVYPEKLKAQSSNVKKGETHETE